MNKNKWIEGLSWEQAAGKQTRSQRTREALLNAAEKLFAEFGVEASSIAEIAKGADCSVGAFYHHFKDKNALLTAIYMRMAERYKIIADAAVDPERWEGARIEDILRGYLEFVLKVTRENPGHKIAALEAMKRDPALERHYGDLEIQFNTDLRKLLLARKGEIGHSDPDVAVRFVLDQFAAMVRVRKESMIKHTQMGKRSEKQFIEQALQSAKAYLQIK